jgi:prepilin-type processing-associated H-X9-DG protein
MDHESVNPVPPGADLRDIPYVPHRQPINPQFIQVPNKITGSIHDHLYQCVLPAQALRDGMPCNTGNELIAAPRSRHSGGVNAAAIDGHVGFILNDVDPYVMAAIISIRDGVAIDITDGIR